MDIKEIIRWIMALLFFGIVVAAIGLVMVSNFLFLEWVFPG